MEDFLKIFENISSFDLIYIFFTLLSLIKCYRKGFVLSILSMAKWLLAYVITLILFPRIKPYFKNVIDNEYGGLAFTSEGERCVQLLSNPSHKTMIMGNHGILTIGDSVAETFNRMYYFERAARNYIQALQTGQPLRILSDDVAEKTAEQLDAYPEQGIRHFDQLLAILEREEPEFRD